MMKRTLALAALGIACSGGGQKGAPAATPATPATAAAEAPRLRPAPGADLDGPLPPPSPPPRAQVAKDAAVLDLGSDRPVVAVEVPRPPRGGAAAFTFGDERRGWVARIPETNQLPSPAYGDGRIYISGGFESISFYALDADSGQIVWASQALEDNGPTAAIYEDGKVIFNTESCTLFVLDAATGRKLWYKYLGDPTLAQPAVSEGLIFASHPSDGGPALSAYKLSNGDVVWTRTVGGELLAAPVVAGDSVYASTIEGWTYRFVRKTGKQVWAKPLKATTAPWIYGNELFVSRREGSKELQVVVSATTGEIVARQSDVAAAYLGDVPRDLGDWKKVWAFEGSRPVVLGGVKYEAMGGLVRASDPLSGDPMWIRRYAAGEGKRSTGAVAVAGPQVVVSTRKGEVFGLDIDTGYTLWSYGIGHEVVAQPIVARGWIYAATTDGTVVALNVADTSLDGWHMWGGDPHHNGLVQ